jgi:hypothetical protein
LKSDTKFILTTGRFVKVRGLKTSLYMVYDYHQWTYRPVEYICIVYIVYTYFFTVYIHFYTILGKVAYYVEISYFGEVHYFIPGGAVLST